MARAPAVAQQVDVELELGAARGEGQQGVVLLVQRRAGAQ
ncbi:MAG: hypothetical protein QOK49_1855, partial [Baekduia sp.]|nr:hypothetical protein [Baekduia sp.]